MAFQLAEAYVELNARGFGGVSGVIDQVTNRTVRMGSAFSMVSGLLPSVGAMLGALGVGAGAAGMVRMAAEAERTAATIETLVGSASQARKLIDDLANTDGAAIFGTSNLERSAQQLINFQVPVDQVAESVDRLSNIAAGDNQKLQSLSLVFGQIASSGFMNGGDRLQFINAGFNPLNQIVERTGESMDKLLDRISKGKVSFDEVSQAIKDATSEGGQFYQMNQKVSDTVFGQWSKLGASVSTASREIGQGIIEAFDLKDVLGSAIQFTDGFRVAVQPIITDVIPSIRDLMDSLADSFGFAWGVMTGATGTGVDFVVSGLREIGDWAVFLMDTTAFVVNNWGLLWAIAYENAALTFSNILEIVSTWGVNAVELGSWFFENWKEIFVTLGNFTVTVFKNLAQNIQAALAPVHTSIAEMMLRAAAAVTGTSAAELQQQIDSLHEAAAGRQVPFTGLLDGLESSISKMPELTKAAVAETSEELDRLNALLGENALAAGYGLQREKPASFAEAAEELRKKASKAGRTDEAGKGGSIVGLADLAKGVQTTSLKKAEQFAEKTAEATAKLAGAVGSDGKLKTSSGPAVAS